MQSPCRAPETASCYPETRAVGTGSLFQWHRRLKGCPCFQRHLMLKTGYCTDHRTMVIDMNEARLDTIEQIREFLAGTAAVTFTVPPEEAKLRQFVVTVLRRFRYFGRAKGQRGVLFAYMQRLTGYSRQHLSRLVAQYRDTQSLRLRDRAS